MEARLSYSMALLAGREVYKRSGVALYPFQVEGIHRCTQGNTLLDFEMGLGKTLTAILSVRHLNRVLFVVPKIVIPHWLREIRRGTGKETLGLLGTKRLRIRSGGDGWVIASHEAITNWGRVLGQREGELMPLAGVTPADVPMIDRGSWDALVVDEVHRFGPLSKRTVGLLLLARKTDRVICLSGTPMQGGSHRLWTVLQLLSPGHWGDYYTFIKRYAAAEENEFGGLTPRGVSNAAELTRKITPFFLSFGKAEVAPFLPRHIMTEVEVPLTPSRAIDLGLQIDLMLRRVRDRGYESIGDLFKDRDVVDARMSIAAYKLSAAKDLAEQVIREGRQVVVWCWHREAARLLALEVKDSVVVSGAISEGRNNEALEKFKRGHVRCLVSTIAKLGIGFDDLTVASDQIVLELPWLPEELVQALSRLDRIGQTKPVHSTLIRIGVGFEESLCVRLRSRINESRVTPRPPLTVLDLLKDL